MTDNEGKEFLRMKKYFALLIALMLCFTAFSAASAAAPVESPYTLKSDPNKNNTQHSGEMAVFGNRKY